eukprot:CAMPEP_0196763016 /NCGR_PEP_ID=MMETSP1095-20130614/3226_1 /TAXON_ID=96789 ORGANISM="Chromulina nebulosa, Strain UTEXLB2642" /NCGR_SAMPLE_ID=MMETSP1095 /ASSEMBLY_ACC=CAM_ASM_000446 /LENGTH=56 /DNA_ID=CAMNT_0042115285 /DNA_START=548 /DNA_END=718 /DNA_ORIENTATION=-
MRLKPEMVETEIETGIAENETDEETAETETEEIVEIGKYIVAGEMIAVDMIEEAEV